MFQANSNVISDKEKTRSGLRSIAGEGTEEKYQPNVGSRAVCSMALVAEAGRQRSRECGQGRLEGKER